MAAISTEEHPIISFKQWKILQWSLLIMSLLDLSKLSFEKTSCRVSYV